MQIFEPFFKKRPEVVFQKFKSDLERYYLPYVNKLIELKKHKQENDGMIVGISAIQGAGKSTQGEVLEVLVKQMGYNCLSLSIDDHYITHEELNNLRARDPRFIRRGVTHDVNLAISDLTKLKTMESGETITVTHYDKSAFNGDGDRGESRGVDQKPDFIFYDGWMLGARSVTDGSVFDQNLPALETLEAKQFAKDVNKKLVEYEPLWKMIEFMNVLYVPHYEMSLVWRENAEKTLRKSGEGMSEEQIKKFVHYFWRSVHPAIHIKNLAQDSEHVQQVAIIGDDHSILEVLSPTVVSARRNSSSELFRSSVN